LINRVDWFCFVLVMTTTPNITMFDTAERAVL